MMDVIYAWTILIATMLENGPLVIISGNYLFVAVYSLEYY